MSNNKYIPMIIKNNELKNCVVFKTNYNTKCGKELYCREGRMCNIENKCEPIKIGVKKIDNSMFRKCTHPNDKLCIPNNACFDNGICSSFYLN